MKLPSINRYVWLSFLALLLMIWSLFITPPLVFDPVFYWLRNLLISTSILLSIFSVLKYPDRVTKAYLIATVLISFIHIGVYVAGYFYIA